MTPARRYAAVAVAAVLVALALAPGQAAETGPNSHVQPLLDGCQRSQSLILAGSTPEWVYVNADVVRRARLLGDNVTGRRTGIGTVTETRPAGEDIYLSHDFHDMNIFLRPDPAYEGLLGSGNRVPGEESNQIEGEWEVQEIPFWAWPAAGDRAQMSGNWIWDCGHWGNSAADPTSLSQLLVYDPVETAQDLAAPGTIRGETTELHPLYEVATFRANAAGVLRGHGPRRMSKLDVWINGDGTPAHAIEECALRGIANWALGRVACQEARDVSGTYAYTMKLPPRPSRTSKLILNRMVVHRETDPLLRGVPVSIVPDARRGIVTVRFTLPRSVVPQRFGITVAAGWSDDLRPVRHRITLHRLQIARSLDGDSEPHLNPGNVRGEQTAEPGEWVLYGNISGRWFQFPGVSQATDGKTIDLGLTLDVWLPRGVAPRLFVSGHECDEPLMDCIHEGTSEDPDLFATVEAGFNDRPGRIENHGAGIPMIYGTTVYRPPANPDPTTGNEDLSDAICGLGGCYQLAATWTVVQR